MFENKLPEEVSMFQRRNKQHISAAVQYQNLENAMQ